MDKPEAEQLNQFRKTLRRDWAKRAVADHKEARKVLRQLVAEAQDTYSIRVPTALVIELRMRRMQWTG